MCRKYIKKLPYCISLICLAVTTGCQSDKFTEEFLTEISVTGYLSIPESTKTQIAGEPIDNSALEILWTPGDRIGVFGTKTRNQMFTGNLESPSTSSDFNGKAVDNDLLTYAYTPYVNGQFQADMVPVEVQNVQDFRDLGSISKNDIKCGKFTGTNVTFESVMSMLQIKVNLNGADGIEPDEIISSVTIGNASGHSLSGQYTLNLKTGELTEQTGNASLRVVFLEEMTVSDGVHTAYAVAAPFVQAGDLFEITIMTDRHVISCSYTAKKDFIGGHWYEMPIDITQATIQDNNLSIAPNVEMPAFSSFSFEVSHNHGKILDKEVYYNGSKTLVRDISEQPLAIGESTISACIPYLFDFNLVPSFTVDGDENRYVVKVNGTEQVSGESAQDFSETVTYLIYDTETGGSRKYKVEVTNTGLPVVVLTQHSSPSSSVGFLDMQIPAKTCDFSEEDMIAIYEHGVPSLAETACGYRIRGNITQSYPKKALAVKLASKSKVLGMNKHKRWCLLANWKDNTLMRNDLAFQISKRMTTEYASDGTGIIWAPSGKHVELVLNGRHVGNYYLCEQIKIDKNRVAIQDNYEGRLEDYIADPINNPEPSFDNCGYLVEVDNYYDEVYKFRTSPSNLPMNMKDDFDATELGQSIFNQLKNEYNSLDSDIVNGNWDAVFEKLDISSTVDYFLLQELTMNNEYKHPRSVYMYKDGGIDETHVAGGKFCFGPGWDYDTWTFSNLMNLRSYNSEYYYHSYDAFQYTTERQNTSTKYIWYKYLVNSPAFKSEMKSRWATFAGGSLLSCETMLGYIDAKAAELALSAEYNRAMWPHPSSEKFDDYMNGDETTGSQGSGVMNPYSTTIDLLKYFYEHRFAGMSSAVNGL